MPAPAAATASSGARASTPSSSKRFPQRPTGSGRFELDKDRLDFSALFQAAGYTGSDPIADGYVVLQDDGRGGTLVSFSAQGHGLDPTPIADLGKLPFGVTTWQDLTGGIPSGDGVFVSPAPGSVETGTAGPETFYASQGNDTLTGGAGADVFVVKYEPWAPDHITDFQVGTDRLDLSSLFQAAGYTGSDPVADGYIVLASDGNGGTIVRFDQDGSGPTPQWPSTIIDLEGVSPAGLTWSELSTGSGSGAGAGHGSTGTLTNGNGGEAPLADGGHVQVTLEPGGDAFAIQKYDASGAAVGPTNLWSLQVEATRAYAVSAAPDGGFVMVTAYSSPGGSWEEVETFNAQGQQISATPNGGPAGWLASVTATAGEGYLVGLEPNSIAQSATSFATTGYELLDAHGNFLGSLVQFAGTVQSVTADAKGDAVVTWDDAGTPRTFTFDPHDSSNTAAVSAPTIEVLDGQGAPYGSIANDAPAVLRIEVSQVGELHAGTATVASALTADAGSVIQVTAADVARGYVDVSLTPGADGEYAAFARFVNPAGAASSFAETQFSVQGGGDSTSGGTAGQVFTSPGPGSVETGTAGADTFFASQGADTLTGGAGADVFVFQTEPWAPDHITDFQVGSDKLDLSALFQAAGYVGSDPVADHYVTLESDGNGGTTVRFDASGQANIDGHWPNTIIDLEHVSPANLTWSQLTGGGPTDTGGGTTGGGTAGQVFTSPGPGAVEVGTAGADTFVASQGNDTLTGGAGADVFVFDQQPWAPIHVADFTPGEDKLDLSALFRAAGYTGADPIADHYIVVDSDGNGGATIRFDAGGQANIGGHWPNTIIDLEGVAPSRVSESDWIIH